MKIEYGYCIRSKPKEDGEWGNGSIDEMIKTSPWVAPLVAELRAESKWSKRSKDGCEWIAKFFEDAVTGQPPILKLTLIPYRQSLEVPSIFLNPKKPPTLHDIERLIIADIRPINRKFR